MRKDFAPNTIIFYEFINKRRAEDKNYTHLSMGYPLGKYNIASDDMIDFYKLYRDALKEGTKIHLVEAHYKYQPIIIDIDFKYTNDSDNRLYKEDDIKRIVRAHNEIIKEFLDIDNPDIKAFVFEKEKPSQYTDQDDEGNAKYKDGIHIMYPDIICPLEFQFVVRDKIVKFFEQNMLFPDVKCENTVDDIFDKSVIRDAGWMVYGSCKSTKHSPYLLTKVYNYKLLNIDLKKFRNKNLIKKFSIRKDEEDIVPYNEDNPEEYVEELYSKLNVAKPNRPQSRGRQKKGSVDDIRKAKLLVELLSDERADTYKPWMELGWCLKYIDASLFDTWVNFSMRNSDKFDLRKCEFEWKRARAHTRDGAVLTMGSLYMWAKEDNPDGFFEFHQSELKSYIENSITGTSADVAKVVYEKFKYQYCCASVQHKAWYEFREHRWVPIEKGWTLFRKLNEDIVTEYLNQATALGQDARGNEGNEREMTMGKQTLATKVSIKLRTIRFKEDIMKECMYLFHDEKFLEKLDEQRHLIGFNNGVYDLDKLEFRDGRPEDYMSLTCNIDFFEFEEDDEIIKNIRNFVRELQPEKDMANYIMDLMASCLQGHTPDEKFHMWTGNGSNGKSLIIRLFMLSLGEYAATVSSTFLTTKRAASHAATPDLARTKGKRFCILNEPEGNDKIYVGRMKELTGGDPIVARQLYKEPIEFLPQFKMLLLCNDLPTIPSNDGGTWRRIRVVPFEMKFVDNPKKKNERKINRNLKEELDYWKEGFMWLLIERFRIYKEVGLVEPLKVTIHTNKYQEASDIYQQFLSEYVVVTRNPKDKVNGKDLYNEFKNWLSDASTNVGRVGRSDFKRELEKKDYKSYKGDWIRMILKSEMEDQDEEENMDEVPYDEDDGCCDDDAVVNPGKKTKRSVIDALG
jgi:P4 family phage/plasmid primase-like protien